MPNNEQSGGFFPGGIPELPEALKEKLQQAIDPDPEPEETTIDCPHCQLIYNLFSDHTTRLTKFIETLLKLIIENFQPVQPAEPASPIDSNMLGMLAGQLFNHLGGGGNATNSGGGKFPNVG